MLSYLWEFDLISYGLHKFWLLKEGFDCWYFGRFEATVLICQAACEAILKELFLGENEKKTVRKLGGNWEKLKKWSKLRRRFWILWKQNKISKETYKGLRKVKRIRNKIAHGGSRKNVKEVFAKPWLHPKEVEERAFTALKFAALFYSDIYGKYPFGPYREQWLDRERKEKNGKRRNLESNHAWICKGPNPALFVAVLIDAEPL